MKARLLLSCLAVSFFSLDSPVLAGVFDALCNGDKECRVSVGDGKLVVGNSEISVSRIISWEESLAKTGKDAGLCLLSITACALTNIHDYRYNVYYMNDDGDVSTTSFRFVNNEPAARVKRQLTSLTNLAPSQVSEEATSKAAALKKESTRQKLINSLDCSPLIKPYGCSFTQYMNSIPSVKAWAIANPSLVESQMIKMKAIEAVELK
jgi:hypothetical protein